MQYSMSEPEVKSPIADVLRSRQVLFLLLRRHGIPHAVPLLVTPYVVELRAGIEDYEVDATDGDQDSVAAAVPRGIILEVYVSRHHRAELYKHVVERGVDRPTRYCAGVTRAPAHLNGMGVRVREQGRRNALEGNVTWIHKNTSDGTYVVNPLVRMCGQTVKCDEER